MHSSPILLGNTISSSSKLCAQFISASTYSGAGSFAGRLYLTPSSQRYSYLRIRDICTLGKALDIHARAQNEPWASGHDRTLYDQHDQWGMGREVAADAAPLVLCRTP